MMEHTRTQPFFSLLVSFVTLAAALTLNTGLAQSLSLMYTGRPSMADIGAIENFALTRSDFGLFGPIRHVSFSSANCDSRFQGPGGHVRLSYSCPNARQVTFHEDGRVDQYINGPESEAFRRLKTFQYDADGRLDRVSIDGSGHTPLVRFFYDNPDLTRVVEYDNMGNVSDEYWLAVDDRGRLVSIVEGSFLGSVRGVGFYRDEAGRVTGVGYLHERDDLEHMFEYEGANSYPSAWITPSQYNFIPQLYLVLKYVAFDDFGNWLTRQVHITATRFGEEELVLLYEDHRVLEYHR